MEPIISKEELRELSKIKGEGRGVVFKPELEFILEKEGKKGLKKLEDALSEFGFPMKYDGTGSADFYPLKTKAVMLLAIKRLFHYENDKFREMGKTSAKFPILLRRFMGLIGGKKMVFQADRIWKNYFTAGRAEVVEFSEESRREILRLHDFNIHPLECQFLIGYFESLLQMIVKEEVSCRETKCYFSGDSYHEFILTW